MTEENQTIETQLNSVEDIYALDNETLEKIDINDLLKNNELSETKSSEEKKEDLEAEKADNPPPQTEETIKKELEETRNELERQKEILRSQEEFKQKRNIEVGYLRKLANLTPEEKEKWKEKFFGENPQEAVLELVEKAEVAKQHNIFEKEQIANFTEKQVKNIIPNFDSLKNDIVKLIKTENIPDDIIHKFQENPFKVSNVGELINLSKRVLLSKEIEVLKKENQELKQKKKNIVQNIERVTNQPKQITDMSENIDEDDMDINIPDINSLYSLPEKELNKLSAKLKKIYSQT